MVRCSCFGTAASSRVPVKRYNQYVKDVFDAKTDPNTQVLDDELPRPMVGKIRKLTEYAEKNPHRIPKIARRLMRRAVAYARRRKVHLVHVVVRCFEAMLRDVRPCPITVMATEIHRVIGLLVSEHSEARMDFQGLQLLFVFLRALHDASQWTALEKYFEDVFRHARRTESDEPTLNKQKGALLCAGEVVRIIGETFHYFPSFEIIVQITMDALDPEALANDPEEWNADQRTLAQLLQLPLSSIAWGVFGRLEGLAGNAFGATRMFHAMLKHFDEKKLWAQGGLAFPCLLGIATRNDDRNQALVLVRILLQHLESKLLPPDRKPAYLDMVLDLSQRQMDARPVSALILYVKGIAPRLPSTEHRDEVQLSLRDQMLRSVEKLASCAGPEVSLADTMASLLYTLPPVDPERLNVLMCLQRIATVLEPRSVGKAFPRALFRSLLQTFFSTTGPAHEKSQELLVQCYRVYPSLKLAQWNLLNSTFWQVATDEDAHNPGLSSLGELHRTLVLKPEHGDSLQSVTLASGLWKYALEPYTRDLQDMKHGHLKSACLLKVATDMLSHLIEVHRASARLEEELQPLRSALHGKEGAMDGPAVEGPDNERATTEDGALQQMQEVARTMPTEMPAVFWGLQASPDDGFCRFVPPRSLAVKPHLRQILEQAATFSWSREEGIPDLALPPAEVEEHEATSSTEGDEFEDTSQMWDERSLADMEIAPFNTLVADCSRSFATYQEALHIGLS